MRGIKKVKEVAVVLLSICLFSVNTLAQEVQSIMLKVGLSNQVGGTITITETSAKIFQKGDLYFTVAGQDAGIFLNDVTVETSGGIKGVKTKVTEGRNGKVKVSISRQTKEASSITLKDFNFTVDHTVPEGTYDLELSGSAICDYGDDKLVIKDYIKITTANTQELSSASTNTNASSFTLNEKSYKLNNHIVEMDVAPYLHEKGYMMVPIKYVAQAFGVKDTNIIFGQGQITLFSGSRMIILTVGSTEAKVNGAVINLDAPVENIEGRTYVSASQLAKLLGVTCKWDSETKTAYFTDENKIF